MESVDYSKMQLIELLKKQTRMDAEERKARAEELAKRSRFFEFSFDFSQKTDLQALRLKHPIKSSILEDIAKEAEKLGAEFQGTGSRLRIDIVIDYYDGVSSLVYNDAAKRWQYTEEAYRTYRILQEERSATKILRKVYGKPLHPGLQA